nr:MAG TPA: hypothetical protein [Caudoviricetes sp.]
MDGDGPLVDECKPVGMTGDVLHTLAEGRILKDGEASDAAHSAGLDDGIAKVRCLDELGTLQQQTIDLGGDQQPAALGGDMDGGELGAGVHDVAVDGLLGQGGGGAESRACGGQLHRAVGIHLQRQRITGTVQTVSHQIVGDAGGVEAVDDLIDGLVLVDVDGEIGGVAAGQLCAGLLVVVVHSDFSVADGDFDGTGLGAALIAAVADDADLLDQRRPELEVNQLGITNLCFVCHNISFLSVDLDAGVHCLEGCGDSIGVAGGRSAVLCTAGNADAAALCGLAEGPRICLCGFFQRLVDVGGAVFGGLEGLHVQQGADGLDAAALLAHDGGVQGRVEGEAVCLCLHIAFELCHLGLVLVRGLLAVELGEAVLCGLELCLSAFQLGLELLGGGLLAVDVSAVFAHQPVQLFIGDAGDLCLYVFTLHK